jgi:PAS domain S-box-containing protein
MKIESKMNYRDKTKDELIKELEKLHKEYDSIKLSYLNDITEHKKIEELYKNVISGAPISIFATDNKGIFTLHEGKALENAGMKPGENVGVSAYDLFSDLKIIEKNGEVINVKNLIGRVLNGETVSGYTDLNGVYFDNQFVPIRDISNHVIGLIGVATDITSYKNSEAILLESEARFRSIFENSLIGISIANPEGKLLQVNLDYAQMYGYENPEVMLSEISNVASLYANPLDRKEILRLLKEKGCIEAQEIEVIKRDGSRFFVLVSASEIRDADGKLLFNQATHVDLSDIRKMEVQLQDSHDRLEKLNHHLHEVWENEKSQIAMNLHDDLGQKLTALYLDIAWINSRIGVQSAAVRKKMKEITLMIDDSINGIKEVSSFLRPSMLSDLGLIPAISLQLQKFEKKSGINCHFHYFPDEFVVDEYLSLVLYRILQESLTNIARHSEATAAEVNLNIINRRIELIISDNGIGIDKDQIDSLTSMGLAGIKERAKLVNGKVLIVGEKNNGTTITVTAPYIKASVND